MTIGSSFHLHRSLIALSRTGIDDEHHAHTGVLAPHVGYYRDLPAVGQIVQSGEVVARVDVLGETWTMRLPAGVGGTVVRHAYPGDARPALGYGELLFAVDPSSSANLAGAASAAQKGTADAGSYFCSPASGRFYRRPAPDRPNFVEVGDEIELGRAVGLLEVMKTFSRIAFTGNALPTRVRVTEILVNDQDEVSAGDRLFAFEVIAPANQA